MHTHLLVFDSDSGLKVYFSMTRQPTYGTHTLTLGYTCRKQNFRLQCDAQQDLRRLFPPPAGHVTL